MSPPNETSPTASQPLGAEDRVVAALEAYRAAIDAGENIDREEFLQAYEDVSAEVAACLDNLEFLQSLTPQLLPEAGAGEESGRTSAPSAHLGDFRIIGEIGRGGMGIVYEAEQISLGRRVALKMLPFAALLSESQLQRFKNEARAAATLRHPNIVNVYSVGVERGVNYFAMELIDGPSLAEAARALPEKAASGKQKAKQVGTDNRSADSPFRFGDTVAAADLTTARDTSPREFFRTVARLGATLAEALEHAHEQGVIHRDIKPGNILLDREGKPWITDFGLARLEADASMTQSGDFLGTARYMSPEQARGDRTIDHRTDVYSLGITLYELATGRPAFEGDDRRALLRQIEEQPPRSPRQIRATIPPDLETIILKAIEKDADDRYAAAADLAADLQHYLSHEPIKARRPGLLGRGVRWARRHPSQLLAASIALSVCLLAALVAAGISHLAREQTAEALTEVRHQRDRANAEAARANSERQQSHDSLKLARNVIDSLYTKVGTGWIADDSSPANFQRQILAEAAEFYRRLAAEPIEESTDDLRELSMVMSGYGRIGQIQHYLQNYDQAAAARREVIALMQQGLTVDPQHAGILSDMGDEYHNLGQSLFQLAHYDEASEAFQESVRLANCLIEAEIEPLKHRFYLARAHVARAPILTLTGSLPEAAEILSDAKDELSELQKAVSDDQWYWSEIGVQHMQASYWLARTQGHQGDLNAAQELCDNTLRYCRGQRTYQAGDRRLLRMEIALVELSAELSALREDLTSARELYRTALDMRRQRLPGGYTPERIVMEAAFKRSISMDGNIAPGPFCSYVETQLRLAEVFRRANRPYAAEEILGEATSAMAIVVAEYPNTLRYRIAACNTWALAAELLAEHRPTEAGVLHAKAEELWEQSPKEFPHAKAYVSGVHGLETDWRAYQAISRTFTNGTVAVTERGPVNHRDTMFHMRSTGRAWANAGLWDGAVRDFEKSAALQSEDAAYDWLQLAIAHAKLGQQDKSQQSFSRASISIDELKNPDPELNELRNKVKSALIEIEKNQ